MRKGLTELIILGTGGHALVLKALADALDLPLVGASDPALSAAGISDWHGLPIINDDDIITQKNPKKTGLINGIGQLPRGKLRKKIQLRFMQAGFYFPPCIHPSAWVSKDTILGEGCQVMAGAIVQPGCKIGTGSIVNTKTSIDHDCVIGDHVHIAPGATLCGSVMVGEDVFIASGATVIQNIEIGRAAFLSAGATLTTHLKEKTCFGGRARSK